MASITNHFLIFIFVVCFTLSQFSSSFAHKTPIVHFISNLANGTESVQINCKAGKFFRISQALQSGQIFLFKAYKLKNTYYCVAIWGLQFTSIKAFQPKRDKGHHNIYWLVKEHGIYRSWNKVYWKLIAGWDRGI